MKEKIKQLQKPLEKKPEWNWSYFRSLGFELIINEFALFQKLRGMEIIDLKTHHKYRIIPSKNYIKIVGKKSVILIYPPRADRQNALGVRRVPIWELEKDGRKSGKNLSRKKNG